MPNASPRFAALASSDLSGKLRAWTCQKSAVSCGKSSSARDTPAALKEFTAQFHPRLLGLTGSEAQVADALKTFRIYAQKQPGATPDSYLMDHSALFYLFDPDGRPVAFLSPMTAGPNEVAAMLKAHVR